MLETILISGISVPHKSITINCSAEAAVSTASGDFAISGSGVPVQVGTPVTITAGGDLLLTGYVRDVNPSYNADSDRSLSISFASKTVDATETSVDHKTGEVLDKSLPDVAREFDTLGIGIEDDGTFPVEPRHKLVPGESLYDTVERRIRGRKGVIHDTPEGKLKLASKPEGQHSGSLTRGVNITNASATFTEQGRHSDVQVRGQATLGSEAPQLRGQAKAQDSGVKRKRPLILRHEGEALTDRMQSRAEWQVKRGAGQASTASITTIGWRDDGGMIWKRNFLVYVDDDWIGIKGMMVIKSVSLKQDDGGTTATLSLADPRALGGENPRGSTDAAYSAPGNISADFETD